VFNERAIFGVGHGLSPLCLFQQHHSGASNDLFQLPNCEHDFTLSNRFEKARYFASYLGLCPGIHSSGLSSQTLGITKAGNKHLRCLLIEAAQAMSRSQICGKKSLRLLARQKDMNPLVIAYADRAT